MRPEGRIRAEQLNIILLIKSPLEKYNLWVMNMDFGNILIIPVFYFCS